MARLKMCGSEIATAILVDICFLAALALSNYNSVDEHRILVFKEPVQDKALHGHVIRTVQVLNEGSCRVQCYLEPNCVSINVGPLKDGKHQCELNNATDGKQAVDALKPMTGYTYVAIEDNPCSSSPCYNNGTCQAGFTRKGFRCICPVGVVGNTCSRDLKVGCFKIADHDQFEDLHDFTGQVKWDSTIEVVKKCAKLAKEKQYKMFALGDGGVCFSGPDMKEKCLNGSTKNAKCRHGIGIGNSMFVYSLELLSLQPLGCYQDKPDDRALPHEYATSRGSIIWDRLDLVVSKCAQKAYDIGYEYFAVQYYGVCYGNGTNYAKHGNSESCKVFDNRTNHGVGKEYTNFVYRIKKREQK